MRGEERRGKERRREGRGEEGKEGNDIQLNYQRSLVRSESVFG